MVEDVRVTPVLRMQSSSGDKESPCSGGRGRKVSLLAPDEELVQAVHSDTPGRMHSMSQALPAASFNKKDQRNKININVQHWYREKKEMYHECRNKKGR